VIGGTPVRSVGVTRVYACGMTPYETAHVGHAATFVWVDAAVRVLRALGHRTELCRNVTDVDDALTAAAARSDTPYDELAAVQQFDVDRRLGALGVARPTYEPRAHAFVREVVALAQGLLEAGAGYESGGTVYYRGRDVPESAGLNPERALALIRASGDDVDDRHRESPFDTPVWRASADPAAPGWPSPWGRGRPGWHAECTAMTLATFGSSVDLHAGGMDLRFPHHAYESALGESFTGVTPFARVWMHIGQVGVGGEKMSKSAGNCTNVADLLTSHSPAAIRLALIDRPFADSWDYSTAAVEQAAARMEELHSAAGRSGESASAEESIRQALADNLDVPRAVQLAIEAGGSAARLTLDVLGLAELS
jgi:cysteinyl-tRNA synthetase